MDPLDTQAQFEELWFSKIETAAPAWIVYFTASWCAPCKKLDSDAIAVAAKEKGIPIYKCDETVNSYTSGYCAIRKFPTFAFFNPKKIVNTISSADTNTVIEWIQSLSL